MQAQIGHHCGHDGIAGQPALVQQVQAAGSHDLVAIDQTALLVHRQAAVGVAVEGDADVVAAGLYHGGQAVHVGGAAPLVDVHPVGVGVDHVSAQLGEAVEQPGSGGRGGAVGAVHQDAQAAQSGVDGALQMVDIVLAGLGGHIAHLANIATCFHRDIVVAKEDNILDFFLQFIGQLEALAVEDLDAVVLKWIVTGGDNDASVRPLVHSHPGHAWGGKSAQVQHIGPSSAQPSDEGAFQQIPGDPGILPDGNQRLLPRFFVLGQHNSGSQSYFIRQIGIKPGVDYAADSVSPK